MSKKTIHDYIVAREYDKVLELLNAGVSIFRVDLHTLIEQGKKDLVDLVIKNRLNIVTELGYRSSLDYRFIITAITTNQFEIAEKLLEAKVPTDDESRALINNQIFTNAVRDGNYEKAVQLLDRNGSIIVSENDFNHIINNASQKVIDIVVKKVRHNSEYVQVAINSQKYQVVKQLLELGHKINPEDFGKLIESKQQDVISAIGKANIVAKLNYIEIAVKAQRFDIAAQLLKAGAVLDADSAREIMKHHTDEQMVELAKNLNGSQDLILRSALEQNRHSLAAQLMTENINISPQYALELLENPSVKSLAQTLIEFNYQNYMNIARRNDNLELAQRIQKVVPSGRYRSDFDFTPTSLVELRRETSTPFTGLTSYTKTQRFLIANGAIIQSEFKALQDYMGLHSPSSSGDKRASTIAKIAKNVLSELKNAQTFDAPGSIEFTKNKFKDFFTQKMVLYLPNFLELGEAEQLQYIKAMKEFAGKLFDDNKSKLHSKFRNLCEVIVKSLFKDYKTLEERIEMEILKFTREQLAKDAKTVTVDPANPQLAIKVEPGVALPQKPAPAPLPQSEQTGSKPPSPEERAQNLRETGRLGHHATVKSGPNRWGYELDPPFAARQAAFDSKNTQASK